MSEPQKQTDIESVVASSEFETWWAELGEVLACGIVNVPTDVLHDICAVAFESGVMSILKALQDVASLAEVKNS